jgi:hypothetical protein
MTNNQPPPTLPFTRTVVIIRTKPPMAPISPHSGVLWAATIGDAPDRAVSVLADEESAVMRHGYADRTSLDRGLIHNESSHEVLIFAGRLPVL